MLSRIAEALFWLGRYVERAENVARFADVQYHARLERGAGAEVGWETLVAVGGDGDLFLVRYGDYSEANVLAFLASDAACPNSIMACLGQARDNARTAREYVSVEMWEEINRFYLFARGAEPTADPHSFFEEVKRRSLLFSGATDATLLHDEGWLFLSMGACLERVAQTARLLDLQAHLLLRADAGIHQWIALLKSCSAFEAYRRLFPAGFSSLHAVELLLLHRDFPRSAYFGAAQVKAALQALTGSGADRYRTHAEREAARLHNRLAVATPEDVWDEGLHAHLQGVIAAVHAVGSAITREFFLETAS